MIDPDKSLATLVAAEAKPRTYVKLKGQIFVADDFDAPIFPEDE